MTVKYHFSVNGPNRELLGVQAEGVGDQIYSEFRAALADTGLEQIYAQIAGEAVVAQAIAAATAITQPAPPTGLNSGQVYGAAPASYAPPQQPAYQQPAPGAPACHHGPMTRRTGTNSRGAWVGYFCPSPKGTPDQCKARFE